MRLAALRRALLPSAVAAAAFLSAAPAAGAQSVGAYYSPLCASPFACSVIRFQLVNPSATTLLFNTFTLTSGNSAYRFAPAAGGVAFFTAVDAIGPIGGTGTVLPGGSQLAINFLTGSGFSYELDPGTVGYVEVAMAQNTTISASTFTWSGTLDSGRTVSGSVAVVPEPTTVALLGGGLALVGLGARRRRRA